MTTDSEFKDALEHFLANHFVASFVRCLNEALFLKVLRKTKIAYWKGLAIMANPYRGAIF